MFTGWDLDSWGFSVVAMVFMLSILMGIGALVSLLMFRIWGEEREDAATAHMSSTAKEPPIRKAA
jgi:hypothetical protein